MYACHTFIPTIRFINNNKNNINTNNNGKLKKQTFDANWKEALCKHKIMLDLKYEMSRIVFR